MSAQPPDCARRVRTRSSGGCSSRNTAHRPGPSCLSTTPGARSACACNASVPHKRPWTSACNASWQPRRRGCGERRRGGSAPRRASSGSSWPSCTSSNGSCRCYKRACRCRPAKVGSGASAGRACGRWTRRRGDAANRPRLSPWCQQEGPRRVRSCPRAQRTAGPAPTWRWCVRRPPPEHRPPLPSCPLQPTTCCARHPTARRVCDQRATIRRASASNFLGNTTQAQARTQHLFHDPPLAAPPPPWRPMW